MKKFFSTIARFEIAFLFLSGQVLAETGAMDSSSQEALLKTVELLSSPKLRNEAIQGDPKAQRADAQVKSLAPDPALQEEIYRLSSEIFAELAQSANGDLQAMTEKLQKAKDDPRAFAESLSPKSRTAIRELALKLGSAPVAPANNVRAPAATGERSLSTK